MRISEKIVLVLKLVIYSVFSIQYKKTFVLDTDRIITASTPKSIYKSDSAIHCAAICSIKTLCNRASYNKLEKCALLSITKNVPGLQRNMPSTRRLFTKTFVVRKIYHLDHFILLFIFLISLPSLSIGLYSWFE